MKTLVNIVTGLCSPSNSLSAFGKFLRSYLFAQGILAHVVMELTMTALLLCTTVYFHLKMQPLWWARYNQFTSVIMWSCEVTIMHPGTGLSPIIIISCRSSSVFPQNFMAVIFVCLDPCFPMVTLKF